MSFLWHQRKTNRSSVVATAGQAGLPIPVAYDHSLANIAGLNPAEDMGVCVVLYSTGKETNKNNKDNRPTAEKQERRIAKEEKQKHVQGGSNMTGTNCDLFTHNQSRSYLNHLVYFSLLQKV